MIIKRKRPGLGLAGLTAALLIAAPAAAKDRSAPAVGQDPASWVTTEDYPAAALSANAEGVSKVRWDITAEGKAENCTTVESSGLADLDQAACTAIIARARYVPALDKKGRPIRSRAERRVRWQIPEAQSATSVPYTLRQF